ncbi:uncharacterized protein LOC131029439 [Cryptomeria japonica]|uniref:uncharacterized protein LOC131029439 n=1 Tax=Cryptomeria japonica TaxID=3369 RepID=UPI0025AD8D7B|nr:uncharacterized protein LOC131029439 [Cryptomeria japonica]XP_057815910.1 uncharacterized protein LOC131029439 [Cryptomeria japonica]XP_057815911.1 uncharacterized protein LOC131029439 [Cryptomeria japonica]
MTKNHLKKRSTKEQPGCMGGIISLFDFNHHPSGRKLITEKAHADGSRSSRISFDVANEYLETPKSRDARNEYALTHDTRRNPSTQKKASGIPMKALIAEEMTKEFESKRRTPGVVARLMGLEAMPAETLLGEHSQELDNDPQKIISAKQQQQPKSNCDGRKSPQKSRASGSKPIQEISLSVSQLKTSNCPDQRAHSCIDQSQEKQREELCQEFETLEDLKSRDCSNAQQLDEQNIQPVEKHMLVHEKLDEPDMALEHQKFVDAKNLVADEKLQQSKEFLDALEVLQSNRDLFLKFLQEPNSFFTKHLQEFQSTPQTPETMKTKMKSANARKTAEELKTEDISRGQYPTEDKKHDKQFQKQKGPRSLTGKEEELQVKSPSSGTKDRYKQYSIESAPVKGDACALPTRIVILKPGPGSASNARSPSSPSWSPRSEASFRSLGKGDRASTRDFLQEVRERLRLGLREYRKDDSKVPQDGDHGQIKDGPKDPKEIAREIARHVRESVARDLTHKPIEMGEVSTSFNNFISKRNLLNQSRISSGETCVSSDTEVSTPVTKHSLDHTKRSDVPMSQPANKWHSFESTVDREAKKRLSERLKMSHVDEDKQQSRGDVNTLGKILALQEDKKPICRSKSPQNKKIRNVVEEGEQLYGQVRHEVGANCTYHRDGDENRDIISPKSLGKSHSGPLSSTYLVKDNDDVQHTVSESLVSSRSGPLLSTAFDKNNEEIQCRVSDVMRDNAHEMISDNSSTNLSAERYKTKGNGSFFEGEASSLTGSFLMLGRKSSRKFDSSTEPDTNIHGPLEEACDPPKELRVESEKDIGNLEDLLILENQECPKRSIDSPDMGNIEFKLSADLGSRPSPADTKGLGGTISEPLEWRPDSMLADPLQSGDQTDYATEVIPPEQPLSSPTFDSPTKQFPIRESRPPAINVEKPEQPSPVSVLDSPFQEETPSPKDFKKVNSDLQELRLRIRLLKFDGSERQNLKADNLLQGDRIMSDGLETLDCREADTLSEKTCNSASESMTSSVSRLQFLMTENVDLEFSKLDDISCPKDKLSDLCYVRNVLVASGFTGDGIIPNWHVPNHPLDPSLFEKIENLLGHNSEGDKTKVQGSKWERRLLFDSINEVLAKILDPFSNHNPWLKETKLSSHCKPAGKRLLRDTWAAISSFLYTQSETTDTLEKIIAKDMAKGGLWMELRNDVEAIGCQVEKAIFGDLIEEVIFDLVL